MARRIVYYTHKGVEGDRDSGKQFVITEMPPTQGEAWAIRAVLAIVGSAKMPENAAGMGGIVDLLRMGVDSLSSLKWDDAKPLLDEMMDTIRYRPDPKVDVTFALTETDIEEIGTRIKLKKLVWDLNAGFLLRGLAPASQTSKPASKG
jgi:hypothetical protein